MFKQLVSWFNEFFGFAPEPEKPLPEDAWLQMFYLAEKAKPLKLAKMGITHFDVHLEVFTKNVDELFMRLELLISSIEKEADSPDWWEERERDRWLEALVDYYYEVKPGYRHPQEVLRMLVEKVEVIHNLLEVKEINQVHPYYHYMRKEFYSIISDTIEVLNASIKLGITK